MPAPVRHRGEARHRSSNPTVRVLMLTNFGIGSCVYDSLREGASSLTLKDSPPEEEIPGAVRIAANGEALVASSVARSVIEEFVRHSSHSSTEGQS